MTAPTSEPLDAVWRGSQPAPPAVFVGRRDELRRVAEALLRIRLVLFYGMGGIGKTSLMLHAARRHSETSGSRVEYFACRPGDEFATLVRMLLRSMGNLSDEQEDANVMLRRFLARVPAEPLTVCVDDAHNVGSGFVDALTHLAGLALPISLLVASRSRLPISPATVDHLTVEVPPLRTHEVRELYGELEELYGPSRLDFDELNRRGAGNPLLLKKSFTGSPHVDSSGPVELSLLDRDESAALTELSAHRVPIPKAALSHVHNLEGALESLSERFLVNRSGSGYVWLHDVVRAAVLESSLSPNREVHRRCLEYVTDLRRDAAGADDLLLVEQIHHAVRCHAWNVVEAALDEAASYERWLVGSGGVMREVLAALSAIEEQRDELPVPWYLLKARILMRMGRLDAAIDALETVGCRDDPTATLILAQIRLFRGEPASAADLLAKPLRSATRGVRVNAWLWMSEVGRLKADFRAARRALEKHSPGPRR